jgi:V/A-type H+-transporting ATPase subunit D
MAKAETRKLAADLEEVIRGQDKNLRMWKEFDSGLVSVKEVKLGSRKIAGEKIPQLDEVVFDTKDFDVFVEPKWFLDGIEVLKELFRLVIERDIAEKKMEMLEHARKKTTQKVNLYEKVQIPEYEDAIQKIKRYLEDEENLAKAAQKIVKKRQQNAEEAAL